MNNTAIALLRLRIQSAALIFLALAAISHPAQAQKSPVYTSSLSNTALNGYDSVAYFTQNKSVKGRKEFSTQYKGVSWRFSSAANRDEFVTAPETYAPQYGGYCAYAVSQGHTASGDPKAWTIIDGKLYLNFSLSVRKKWRKDPKRFIELANENWPAVLK